jgi:hypothetical protein
MNPRDQEEDPNGDDAYRKLIRSMIGVLILLGCAALLLALGHCARQRDQPGNGSAAQHLRG